MPRIPEETIVAIREATDLVALVSEYVRDLKASGKNYKGLSPFTSEKTPSFFVSPERQTFTCFSSGERGNCITFLMKMENIGFPEAVRQLGARAGIEVVTVTGGGDSVKRDPLYRLNAWARDWFASQLRSTDGQAARAYLDDRRLSESSQEAFGVGWAPDSWDSLLKAALAEGFSLEDLEESGLIVSKPDENKTYDRFRARVMFPIQDARERVVGFGGRVLKGDAVKYINSPESPVFRKSRNLYGLQLSARGLRRDRAALLCEGYTDVVMAHQYGFDTAVAALGTAFNEEHANLLKRWVERVFLVLDGDEAGKRAAWRALPYLYAADLEVRLVWLPEGSDPCDVLSAQGEAFFRDLIEAAQDPVDAAFAALTPASGPDDIARVVMTLTPLIDTIPSKIRRELTFKKLSDLSGLDEAVLASSTPDVSQPTKARPRVSEVSISENPAETREAERAILGALIAQPNLAPQALAGLTHVVFGDKEIGAMVATIIAHVEAGLSPDPDHVEALFQEEPTIELATCSRQLAPDDEAPRLLDDGLRLLKEHRIKQLESLAREARKAGDTEASQKHERARYHLTRELKQSRLDEGSSRIKKA